MWKGDTPVHMEDADLVAGELVIVARVRDDQGRLYMLARPFVGEVIVVNGRPRITSAPRTTPDTLPPVIGTRGTP